MMWGTTGSKESQPAVGKRAVQLNVEVGTENKGDDGLSQGIRSLYEDNALCDVFLVAGGKCFAAHKAALATYPALRDRLNKANEEAVVAEAVAAAKAKEAAVATPAETAKAETPAAEPTTEATETTAAPAADAAATAPNATEAPAAAPAEAQSEAIVPAGPRMLEVHFPEIACPEAIQIMLAHIYGVDKAEVANYAPSSDDVNKDVLRLASQLQLPSLKEFATHWMASSLTSANAVPRMSTCQEFALHELFEGASEALATDALALSQVTEDRDILKHPRLLQKLLIRVAALYPKGKRERAAEPDDHQQPTKKSKGGA